MSWPVFSSVVRARKEYVCCSCGILIPRRAEYVYTRELYEGKWGKSRWHTECRKKFDDYLTKECETEGIPEAIWDDEEVPQEHIDKYVGMSLENELLTKRGKR